MSLGTFDVIQMINVSNDLQIVKQKSINVVSSLNSLLFIITKTVAMLKVYWITPLLQVDLLLLISQNPDMFLILTFRKFSITF